jgi:hypothetical protein
MAMLAFPQWLLLQHLDVAGLRDDVLAEDEPGVVYPIWQASADAPAPPDGSRVAGLHSIARLTQLTFLRTGCAGPSQAFADAQGRVIAALPHLQQIYNTSTSCDQEVCHITGACLVHTSAMSKLSLYVQDDIISCLRSARSGLTRLQRVELMLEPYDESLDAYEWWKTSGELLHLTQLSTLKWARDVCLVEPADKMDTLLHHISRLQSMCELHISGTDLSWAESCDAVPVLAASLSPFCGDPLLQTRPIP